MRRVLACVMAALLVAGLVPVLPEAPYALADEPEAVLELGDEEKIILEESESVPDDAEARDSEQGDDLELVGGGPSEETDSADDDIAEPDGDTADEPDIDVEVQSTGVSVSNPRTRDDSSMESGQVTTWDCVWFGSYPQSEVEPADAEYASLEALANSGWDANGDATVAGTRYRRVSKDEATYSGYWNGDGYGDATYRYFRYEPIKWRVLEVSGTTALVVADIALDDQRYNANSAGVTWETSSVRSWLNGYGDDANQPGIDFSSSNFVGAAFSPEERSSVLWTTVANEDNSYWGTDGGRDTEDEVFLLNEAEAYDAAHGFASDHGTYDEARRCKASDYTRAMGVERSTSSGYEGNCYWWLRSPGDGATTVAYVYPSGGVDRLDGGFIGNGRCAVRPALNLDLSASYPQAAGTVSSNGEVNEQKPTKPLQGVALTTDPAGTIHYGDKIKLTATADGGKGTLTYTFVAIDEAGAETTIQAASDKSDCVWTPAAVGSYTLRVDVTDSASYDGNALSSEPIPCEVLPADVGVKVRVTNPYVRVDSSMESGKVTIWDCVWFGSYPQTEIKPGDAVYNILTRASWDASGDATVGNTKYHRISEVDAEGYIEFGSDTYRYFRYEPVKWRVLDVEGDTALVLSDVALDYQSYNTKLADMTWETSSIRSWLNGYGAESNQPGTNFSGKGFIDKAFSFGERSAIVRTDVANDDNRYDGTNGGNDTKDDVFLLSEAEACDATHGFASSSYTEDVARHCKASDYACVMGDWWSTTSYEGNCEWWLRSPGGEANFAAYVRNDGYVISYGDDVRSDSIAVRPALNLNLTSYYFQAAGTVSSNGEADEQATTGVKPLQGVNLAIEETGAPHYGVATRLAATADGGTGALSYTFVVIDETGAETTIQAASTTSSCIWTPTAIGSYTLRVDVTDSDSYEGNALSSELVNCEVLPADVEVKDGKSVEAAGSLTYGQKLSELAYQNATFVAMGTDVLVTGTFSYDEPDAVLQAGTHQVGWTFVPSSTNYAPATGTMSVQVDQATPTVSSLPQAETIAYHPQRTLADVPLTGGSASVEGSWQWTDRDVVPDVPGGTYACEFVPTDGLNYRTVDAEVELLVTKATPVLNSLSATIVYGQSLGDATLVGVMRHEQGDGVPIEGRFVWVDPQVRPAVADSDSTPYGVLFVPFDTDRYEQVETSTTVTVATFSEVNRSYAESTSEWMGDVGTVIGPAQITSVKLGTTSYTYNGKAKEPGVKVMAGDEEVPASGYDVSYENNVNAGTATVVVTGKDDYEGTLTATFAIKRASVVSANVTGVNDKTYTGKALTQKPTVKVGSRTLKKGTDYKLSYEENVNAGTATMTVTGIGNYRGSVRKTFKIAKAANPMKVKAVERAVKASKVKKKAQVVAAPLKFTKKAKGEVAYARVAKGSSKLISVNKKTGKVTVAKGTKKGTYKVKIKVTAAGTDNYEQASKTLTCTVVVK